MAHVRARVCIWKSSCCYNYERWQRVHPEVRRHYRLESMRPRERDERMSRRGTDRAAREMELNVHPLYEERAVLAAMARDEAITCPAAWKMRN